MSRELNCDVDNEKVECLADTLCAIYICSPQKECNDKIDCEADAICDKYLSSRQTECDKKDAICAIPICSSRKECDKKVECEADALCAIYICSPQKGCDDKISECDADAICDKYLCTSSTPEPSCVELPTLCKPKPPTKADVICHVDVMIPRKQTTDTIKTTKFESHTSKFMCTRTWTTRD